MSVESSRSAPPDFVAGQKLAGCYVLGRCLENGDGAVVWLAYDEVRGKELSLYFLPPFLRGDAAAMESIRSLVERSFRLAHPHLLQIHDLLEETHWAAIAMDRFDGETLWKLQRRKPSGCFDPSDVSLWLAQLCEALAELHKAGFVHGDVTPANIYIQKNGRLLLANIAISRCVQEGNCARLHSLKSSDDIHALGVLMHVLLAGSPPPAGGIGPVAPAIVVEPGVEEVYGTGVGAMKIPTDLPLSLTQRRSGRKAVAATIPPAWEKVAAACLEKNPELRPATAAEVAARLVPEKSPMPTLAVPKGVRRESAIKTEVPAFARPKMPPIGMLLARPKNVPEPARPEIPKVLPVVQSPPPIPNPAPKPAVPGLPILSPIEESKSAPSEKLEIAEPLPREELVESIPTPPVKTAVVPAVAPNRKLQASLGLAAALMLSGAAIYVYCVHQGREAAKRRSMKALEQPALSSVGESSTFPVRKRVLPERPTPPPEETLGAPPLSEPEPRSTPESPAAVAGSEPAQTVGQNGERLVLVEPQVIEEEIEKARRQYEEKLKALAETLNNSAKGIAPAVVAPSSSPEEPAKSPEPIPPVVEEKMPESEAAGEKSDLPKAAAEKTPDAPPAPEAARKMFENSLGMRFVPVGKLLVSIWPTRFADFEAFANATKFRSRHWKNAGSKLGADHPVVYVSWLDAMSFCKWLTEKERAEGLLRADQSYRLPRDLEWSEAIGIGQENGETPAARDMGMPDLYPWGNAWPPPQGAGNYAGEETRTTRAGIAIPGYKDAFAQTAPVGSFPPNSNGLYDMGGNVWQWCMEAWSGGDPKAKVLRGASWSDGRLKPSLLSTCRIRSQENNKADNYGFRCVIVTGE